MEKLKKFKPLIAVFNGKCERSPLQKGDVKIVTAALSERFLVLLQASMKCSAESSLARSHRSWNLACSLIRSPTVTW